MELNTYKCDECPAIRKEANHWFKMTIIANAIIIQRWDMPELEGIPRNPTHDKRLHLCSESCAAKAMSKAIGAGQ